MYCIRDGHLVSSRLEKELFQFDFDHDSRALNSLSFVYIRCVILFSFKVLIVIKIGTLYFHVNTVEVVVLQYKFFSSLFFLFSRMALNDLNIHYVIQ